MKKKLLLIGALVLSIGLVWKFSNQESDIEKLRKSHAEFLKNHPYNKTLALTKKERKAQGLPPNKFFEQEYLLEMNPATGRTHPENYLKVQEELRNQRQAQRVVPGENGNEWVERGPNNIGGRTRMVMFDPNDGTYKKVFAGGVSGGLWVNTDITDANSSWTRVGIPENLSVKCMTVDPNNSQIFYLGTGESYTGDDGVGNGVWKSTDGGVSWSNVFNDNFNSNLHLRLYYINDIIAWNNPSTSKTEVFIGVAGAYYGEGAQWVGASKTGLYKSTDDGANWSRLSIGTGQTDSGGNETPHEPNDLEIGADNTIWMGTERNPWGHGGGKILKSTDGTSFTEAHAIPNGRRTEIAVSKTDKDKIYILNSVTSSVPTMWVTTDGFSNVTSIITPADADNGIPNNDFTRGQSWYDLVVEVDPTNDSNVYVGGIDLFRSTDSGSNWTQISKWSNNNALASLNIPLVHADQQGWAFHPTDGDKAIIGNDGGVFYASSLSGASSSSTAIQSRNKDYNVTQFYNGAIGQDVNNELLVAGAQDNGTPFINGASAGVNSGNDVYGGDGAYSFIDKDGQYMIVSYVYNVKHRFNLPYTGAGQAISGDQNSGAFINPSELDDNLDILFTNGTSGGTNQISVFKDLMTSSPVRTELVSFIHLSAAPTVLKVSPYTTSSTTLFAGLSDGKLLKLLNADTVAPTWSNISGPSFSGSISSIEFGANEDEILVTFHNYGVTSVWYTENGGSSWASKEGDFPDIPVKAIMMNPLNNDQVIIGTQLGIWRTANFKDANPTWVQANNGMSNVKVSSLELRTADNTVLASTYGRGMFTGKFTAAVASVDEVIAGKKSFTVYPSTNDGNFIVYAKNTLGKSKMSIFNIRGQKVYSKDLDFNTNENQKVSVQNIKSGMYIVNITGENNKKESRKIIIK